MSFIFQKNSYGIQFIFFVFFIHIIKKHNYEYEHQKIQE